MRKLGKRQLQILQIMAEKEVTIHTLVGYSFQAFFSTDMGDEINQVLSRDRIYGLCDSGLIENMTEEEWYWRGSQYRITKAGREKLDERSQVRSKKVQV